MRQRIIFLMVIVCLVAAGVALYEHKKPNVSKFLAKEAMWRERFQNEESSVAYEKFLETASTYTLDNAHGTAHIIGNLLYEKEKMRGIEYCTKDFNYGCFHGFVSGLIALTGPVGIQYALNTCAKVTNPEDCQHGIGHGIITYLGDNNLDQALRYCPPDPPTRAGGCTDGIFMEYFTGSMRKDTGHPILPLDESNPEGPCPTIDRDFRATCYYELPTWWRALAAAENLSFDEQFEIVAARCGAIDDDAMRGHCFHGAGGQVSAMAYSDTALIKKWCGMMPGDGEESCLRDFRARKALSPEGDAAQKKR